MFKMIRRYKKYRNTYNELSRMTDRDLNDIGISRGDIPYIARECTKM